MRESCINNGLGLIKMYHFQYSWYDTCTMLVSIIRWCHRKKKVGSMKAREYLGNVSIHLKQSYDKNFKWQRAYLNNNTKNWPQMWPPDRKKDAKRGRRQTWADTSQGSDSSKRDKCGNCRTLILELPYFFHPDSMGMLSGKLSCVCHHLAIILRASGLFPKICLWMSENKEFPPSHPYRGHTKKKP